MAGILDRCIWIAAGAGTGSFVQSAAQTGFQTMQSAGAVDAQTYPYAAQSADLSQWEYGLGTWTAASSTLARTTIYGNSLGGTTAINFNTAPQVMVTLTAVTARAMLHGVMGGRLTLASATPVMTANATAQTVVYYTPYLHNNVTCFDGVGLSNIDFVETSVALDTTNWLSGKLYDFFIFLNGSAPTLGYGPAWTNTTTRSAATALTRVQGQWVNNTTITLRTNSTTTFSTATNQATYVGTGYATANGQTGMNFSTTAAGGGGNVLGIYNSYNKVPFTAVSIDSTSSWSYSTNTWRATNNSASNSISYVDGLGDTSVLAYAGAFAECDAGGVMAVGINRDSTSATPETEALIYAQGATGQGRGLAAVVQGYNGTQGFHYIQAMEWAFSGAGGTFYGSGNINGTTNQQSLRVEVHI